MDSTNTYRFELTLAQMGEKHTEKMSSMLFGRGRLCIDDKITGSRKTSKSRLEVAFYCVINLSSESALSPHIYI